MTAFTDFSHKLEVIFFHLEFSIEGAKQAVKGVDRKRSLVRRQGGR